jgi:hypothetical protein
MEQSGDANAYRFAFCIMRYIPFDPGLPPLQLVTTVTLIC